VQPHTPPLRDEKQSKNRKQRCALGEQGKCSTQPTSAGAGLVDATDAPPAAEHAVIGDVLVDAMA
jgi:hypothetical protein